MTKKKVMSLDDLSRNLAVLKAEGKKIVQCHGVFDLLHPGHIHNLHSAKEKGDVLVVSLTKDVYVRKGPNRPMFNENLRANSIAALESVDYVCLIDDYDAVDCIKKIRPDFYVKGGEYADPSKDLTGKIVEEQKAVESVGGKIFFVDLLATDKGVVCSSTNLINNFLGGLSDEQKLYLDNIKKKYHSSKNVIDHFNKLKDLKVLLIGDTIIDQYVFCEPMGQSLKNPLVVNRFLKEETYCGGVLAIANHLAGFCKEVDVVTMIGTLNPYDNFIKKNLLPNVNLNLVHRPNTPTVVKKRYLYKNMEQKIFEVCYIEDEEPISNSLELEIKNYLKNTGKHDLTMVADFGHGILTEEVISQAQSNPVFLAVNSQTNSANLGYNFITKKYNGVNFVTIDEAEARLALHEKHVSLEDACKRLSNDLNIDRIIITCGKNGSLSYERTNNQIHKTPAFASKVVDRVGAGDAVYSVTSLCTATGMPLDLTSFVGNVTGALAVQIVGNKKPVDPVDLYKFLSVLMNY